MDIGLGMSVYTSDGQGIGSVDRLILDPDTNQVKAAVIRKGTFLPHDKEVIRELMDITPDGNIRLTATAADLTAFKTAVTSVLTRYASGILLDPEYGLPALTARDPQAGVLLAYEQTGYDAAVPGRLPALLPE